MRAVRAGKPVSITPRQYVSTVEGGASMAHTAYLGWSKPTRVVHHELGHANRRKTELTATQICGPLARPRERRDRLLPTYADKDKPHVTLHLPKENVIRGGTSLSKNSPNVIKMDRSFQHTFFGSPRDSPFNTPRRDSASRENTPRRRPVPRHFSGSEIERMTQSPRTAWIGEEVPRVQLQEAMVESPRMQRLLEGHPNIDLDRTPARLACSLHHQPATLGPYKAPVMPYNPDFLWVNTDPTYKYRSACPLSPRSRKINGDPPLIPPLQHEKTWDKGAVSRTRDIYSKQMGNPRVLKLECSQNGFFDPNVISNDRAEHLFKEREHAKKVGMDRLLEQGRKEFALLKAQVLSGVRRWGVRRVIASECLACVLTDMWLKRYRAHVHLPRWATLAQEQKLLFEEQFERERKAAEAAIASAAADLSAAPGGEVEKLEAAAAPDEGAADSGSKVDTLDAPSAAPQIDEGGVQPEAAAPSE